MFPNDRIFPSAHPSHYHYPPSQHQPLPAPTSLIHPSQGPPTRTGTPTTATTATTSSTEPHPFHPLPQPIQRPRQPTSHPPLAPPPPPPPPQTISSLSSLILTHPFLPLCIKRLLSLLNVPNLSLPPQLLSHFSESENNLQILSKFANNHGLSHTYERWSPTDVFLASFLLALDDAKAGLQATVPFQNLPLQHTVNIAKEAIAPKTSTHACNRFKVEKVIKKSGGANPRNPLSEQARSLLENWFTDNLENPYPTAAEKEHMAGLCNISMDAINNWFGNKRMRIKRKMLNVDSPSTSPNNNDIGDKVLAPRSKWNAVVISRMNSEKGRAVVANATGRATQDKNATEPKKASGSGEKQS